MAMTDGIMTAADMDVERFRASLLGWYDRHRRVLPWRALPGETADPYRVWLSEVMLQQTTVAAVIAYFNKFTKIWSTVHDLAAAPADMVMEAWAGLGYYARARNLHKCAKQVADAYGGRFPDTVAALKSLPGIGDYSSAAIAAIAFNRPANVVDGNVERVMARVFAVQEPLPDCKARLKALAGIVAEGESARPGDYAQALMDLGATICTPTSPKCLVCPVRDFCDGYRQSIAASLPRRRLKKAKPQRHGHVYWITSPDGEILFERRPETGMLGGTVGLPTSAWVDRGDGIVVPDYFQETSTTAVKILHGFTHFDLELIGYLGTLSARGLPERCFWATRTEALALGLPTVFKKALRQFI